MGLAAAEGGLQADDGIAASAASRCKALVSTRFRPSVRKVMRKKFSGAA